jgi:hypothetical protein
MLAVQDTAAYCENGAEKEKQKGKADTIDGASQFLSTTRQTVGRRSARPIGRVEPGLLAEMPSS